MPLLSSRLVPFFHRLLTRPVGVAQLFRGRADGPLSNHEVRLTWLGTAGLALEHQGRTLLVDPFLSRPGFRQTFSGRLRPRKDLIRCYTPRADIIVGSHSHHDHIMDIPQVALLTGARVMGSESLCNLCRAHGLVEDRLWQISPPQTIESPPFRVTLRSSRHAKTVTGKVPLPGDIPGDVRPPLRANQYRNNHTFGVLIKVLRGPGRDLSVFHLGSADFLPETIEGLRCDVLMVSIVGRHRRPDFTRGLLRGLRPRLVIPIHFDNFFLPLDRPLRSLPKADPAIFQQEVLDSGVDCEVVILDLLGNLVL